jgi:hypothetical protein
MGTRSVPASRQPPAGVPQFVGHRRVASCTDYALNTTRPVFATS